MLSKKKKTPKYIIDNIEISTDSDEKNSDEEILMKKGQTEKNSDEEILMRKILVTKKIFFLHI